MRMNYSMMSYTFSRQPRYFDIKAMLEVARDLKMSGVDWVTLHDRPAKELRQMSQDYGLPVVCHTFFADMDFPAAAGRQAGVDAARRGIEAAVALGAPVVMIPTIPKPGEPRGQARCNWIAGLQEVVDFGKQAGVAVTVENFPGVWSPFVTSDDVLEAIQAVPGLRLTFDNGNASGGEPPGDSFARCARYVVHAHFKDWGEVLAGGENGMQMLDGLYYKPALIGEGCVDVRSCLVAMKKSGYQGHINIEYEGDRYSPAEAVRRAVSYLRCME
jgi:sugar phosphate isomerase/epimerase